MRRSAEGGCRLSVQVEDVHSHRRFEGKYSETFRHLRETRDTHSHMITPQIERGSSSVATSLVLGLDAVLWLSDDFPSGVARVDGSEIIIQEISAVADNLEADRSALGCNAIMQTIPMLKCLFLRRHPLAEKMILIERPHASSCSQ